MTLDAVSKYINIYLYMYTHTYMHTYIHEVPHKPDICCIEFFSFTLFYVLHIVQGNSVIIFPCLL